jgi:voltage-gated potassium channel
MPLFADRKPGKRAVDRLLTRPLTVWRASRAIAAATLLVTLAGGILVWVIDHSEFPDIGESLWWSVQTVTTVGYGDVVPHNVEGRVVGTLLMVAGIGFVAVITASIAAAFTQAALQRRMQRPDEDPLADRIEELITRVERLEEAVRSSGQPPSGRG